MAVLFFTVPLFIHFAGVAYQCRKKGNSQDAIICLVLALLMLVITGAVGYLLHWMNSFIK